MISLGLTSAESRALVRSLAEVHDLAVTVHVLDTEHNHKADVSGRLLGGQVDWKAEGRFISSSARVELFDPTFKLGFDTDLPQEGQLFADRMVRVIYSIRAFGSTLEWVHVPIFTGPIAHARRDGPYITVDCVGKEAFAQRVSWEVRSYRAGSNRVAMMRDVMVNGTGESPSRIDFPSWGGRIGSQLVFLRETPLWDTLVKSAAGQDAVLYYDSRGVCRLRRLSNNVMFTFRDGPSALPTAGPTVMTAPKVEFDTDNFRNVVHVKGEAETKGGKPPEARVAVPRSHPLSAWNLGRRGVPRIMAELIEDRDIRTNAEAEARAQGVINRMLREQLTAKFDALPIPFLEPLDLVALQTVGVNVPTFRIREMTIPLSHNGVMSIGTRKRVNTVRSRRLTR